MVKSAEIVAEPKFCSEFYLIPLCSSTGSRRGSPALIIGHLQGKIFAVDIEGLRIRL